MELRQVYDILMKEYGPQGWWPITVDRSRGPEYIPGRYDHPKTEKQVWEVIVGAILTQNTAWKNVEKAILNLLNSNCISPECVLNIEKEKLADMVRPSGYYNQKTERLKLMAEYVNSFGNLHRIFDRPVHVIREELLSIKGIGPETADSILLYAGHIPVFVIDAYTRRFLSRVFSMDMEYDEAQRFFMDNLSKDIVVYKEYHAILVRLGKEHCRRTPMCENCPLAKKCYKNMENKN